MMPRLRTFVLFAALMLLACIASSKTEPLPKVPVSVALMADVQYRTGIGTYRDYPAALANFRTILNELRGSEAVLTIELGDLVEDSSPEQENLDYTMLDNELRSLPMPVRHVPGNNDIAAIRRLQEQRGFGGSNLYYSFAPKEIPGWLFVVLNTSEASDVKMGNAQLFWLDQTLEQAGSRKQKVMIFAHAPPRCLVESTQINAMLAKHRKVIIGWLAGHTHAGEFHQVEGVPEVELSAVLENPERPTYAILKIYPDHWEIEGHGAQKSYRFPLN
ncbi:MAG: metallophosphoesterase [Victivallaceae bacterium]